MNRPNYFSYIEEKLNLLALRINSRGRLNILDFHLHSEDFFQHLINELYGWNVLNENENNLNVEAIDLIDHDSEMVLQVSSTSTKQKIESSLSKDLIKTYSNYTFKFVSIAKDSDDLRKKSFDNPHSIKFNPSVDILDKNSILKTVKGLNIDHQKRIYELIKKELGNDLDFLKLETNLAAVINILSKEDWNKSEALEQKIEFDIERKISFNNLNSSKGIIDDYYVHYGRVDKIYSEFDLLGNNKSNSVLSTIRKEYLVEKSNSSDDELFFRVLDKVQDKVLNSANYETIPVDELELTVSILVVDAFIRCKIFENPENYAVA